MTETGILLVQLGSPTAPTVAAVRKFLSEFLADRRVVDIHPWLWWPLLHGVILRNRPPRSAALYRTIWREDGLSPLFYYTRQQSAAVAQQMAGRAMVRFAMRYGPPTIATVLEEMLQAGMQRLLVFPLFPQYSSSTTASVVDAVYAALALRRFIPAWRVARPFFDDSATIRAQAELVNTIGPREADDFFLFSFHGLPQRYIAQGDPYAAQCAQSAGLLAEALKLPADRWRLAFQSRFGREAWTTPATDTLLTTLPQQGVRHLVLLCPGFVADCLETLDEIAIIGKQKFLAAGGESFRYVPCLNDSPLWLAALTARLNQELEGWT